MINSVSNAASRILSVQNTERKQISQQAPMTLVPDKNDITNSNIEIKSYFLKDLVANGKLKEISDSFRTSDASILDNQVALYDISKYKDLIPFELENNNIYAEVMGGDGPSTLLYSLWVKGPRGPMRIHAQVPCPDPQNHVMDESTFKNTILKGFIIGSEYLQVQKDYGLGVADDHGISVLYDPTTKSIDLKKTLENYLSSYDFYTDGTITPEFRKHYIGSRNLDADPAKVDEAKKHFKLIFEELMKLKF